MAPARASGLRSMRRCMRLHTQAGRSVQKNTPSLSPARPTPRLTVALRASPASNFTLSGESMLMLATMRTISSTTKLIVRYSRSGST